MKIVNVNKLLIVSLGALLTVDCLSAAEQAPQFRVRADAAANGNHQ
jgi:hypothetical protein